MMESLDDPTERQANSGPIITLDGVAKNYDGQPVLGPLTLEIDGSCVGLLGPNGAGKTTLIRMAMGLMQPSEGEIQVLGEHVTGRHVRRRIGYVPEGNALFPGLSGVNAVAYAGQLQGMSKADSLQRAHQVLDYVGLREARYRACAGYSTGMRQRLKLAQALVHDPDLLILDEPTEGVDPQARHAILQLLRELSENHGLRILISTHLLADVEELAGSAVVLSAGQVVAQGTLEELQTAGASGYYVRVDGDPAKFTAQLDQHNVAWSQKHPNIRVALEDMQSVLRHVEESGLVLRHLAPVKLSLEDAFANAVGGADA